MNTGAPWPDVDTAELLIRLTTEPTGELPDPVRGEPPAEADAVEHLRAKAITLIFDPTARTLTADTARAERITIG